MRRWWKLIWQGMAQGLRESCITAFGGGVPDSPRPSKVIRGHEEPHKQRSGKRGDRVLVSGFRPNEKPLAASGFLVGYDLYARGSDMPQAFKKELALPPTSSSTILH